MNKITTTHKGDWIIAQFNKSQGNYTLTIPPLKVRGEIIKRVDNVTFVEFR